MAALPTLLVHQPPSPVHATEQAIWSVINVKPSIGQEVYIVTKVTAPRHSREPGNARSATNTTLEQVDIATSADSPQTGWDPTCPAGHTEKEAQGKRQTWPEKLTN